MVSSSFITALGGALSLFLGVSLSMVFEVVEFLVDVVINVCVFLASGKRSKKEKLLDVKAKLADEMSLSKEDGLFKNRKMVK